MLSVLHVPYSIIRHIHYLLAKVQHVSPSIWASRKKIYIVTHRLTHGTNGEQISVNRTIDAMLSLIRQLTVDLIYRKHRHVIEIVHWFESCSSFHLRSLDDSCQKRARLPQGEHDTIGMIALDADGNMAAGTSTNGLQFKIPGRVSDSALIGSGAYVDNEFGGACATGDGDVMQRFVPSYHAVQLMRQGVPPDEACLDAIKRIARFYPTFTGAVLALTRDGQHGAACHGIESFPYSVMQQDWQHPQVIEIPCLQS
jgi:isoaspartyl peptidase/L-asparaginase-like protein (Ntn-hydrolase superfamily)